MSKYKTLAPILSGALTLEEIAIKKEETKKNSVVSPSALPKLTKEVIEFTLKYVQWMGASSIPAAFKKYHNNGPQDIASKVCAKMGNKFAITEEQVRAIYEEWKMIESNDLSDTEENIEVPDKKTNTLN
jgi:hypothetical protein